MDQAKKVILIVDDTPANIQVALAILKDLYQVKVATNGLKALELAKTEPQPELILLDVVMPGIDGFEVCRELKASSETRDIPVVFLTGRTEIEDETRGFDVGGVDYIHKPFSPAVMKARVNTHLVLRGIREQLSRQLANIKIELETARRIQLSILPQQMPTIVGLDIAARYLPMTEVAGDFYDFIVVDEKRVGTLVADVSGHGMPAALISSMLKIALASQAAVAADPARVLQGLNDALCGKFQEHFVTAAYHYIDTEAQTIRYAGAGHPPLILQEGTSAAHEVLENGLFLGAFEHATYSSLELPFRPGSWALLCTDGVLEMESAAGEEFGGERLRKFVDAHRKLPPQQFLEELLDESASWAHRESGTEAEDDVTLVAVYFEDRVGGAPA